MFADEMCFVCMNCLRFCCALTGIRFEVAAQLIREYIYLYVVFCLKDVKCVYLIMLASYTVCFYIYLDVLSRKYCKYHILLFLDVASNYHCVLLMFSDNISLLFLLLYSLDLI